MTKFLPTAAYACLLAGLAALVGCDAGKDNAVVTGVVTVDGDLARSGSVTFHPVAGGAPATGRVFDDGSYTIRTGQGDRKTADSGDLAPGEYVVTVVVTGPSGAPERPSGPPMPGPRLMASKYATPETSPLRFDVKAGKNLFSLELEGVGAEPPTDVADANGNDANGNDAAAPEAGAESASESSDAPAEAPESPEPESTDTNDAPQGDPSEAAQP